MEKNSDAVICAQNEIQLLKKYSVINFKKCCNIFQMHEVGASAKPLPAKILQEYGFKNVVPGQRLCSRCFTNAGKVDHKVEVVHLKKVSQVFQVKFKVQYKVLKKLHVCRIWIVALHF